MRNQKIEEMKKKKKGVCYEMKRKMTKMEKNDKKEQEFYMNTN